MNTARRLNQTQGIGRHLKSIDLCPPKSTARSNGARFLWSVFAFMGIACADGGQPKWERDLSEGNYIALPAEMESSEPKLPHDVDDLKVPPPPQTLQKTVPAEPPKPQTLKEVSPPASEPAAQPDAQKLESDPPSATKPIPPPYKPLESKSDEDAKPSLQTPIPVDGKDEG